MQTIQQQRAAFALERVERDRDANMNTKGFQSAYKSYASGLPAMIQMNGLGQAAAFYRSKSAGRDSKALAYGCLYELLSDWLTSSGQPYSAHSDLLRGVTTEDMRTYMLAQSEAQALLDWVKKFAKAYMEEPKK
jgi:CRISPR-associated protein Cmr5